MKTITQIQAQITSLASQLSQLADELNAIKAQGAAGRELAAEDVLATIEARAAREPVCNEKLKKAGNETIREKTSPSKKQENKYARILA